jgi:hemerythrin superfamily protein
MVSDAEQLEEDVIDLIIADHEEFKEQLKDIANTSGQQRAEIFTAFRRHLIRHEVSEQEIMWPEAEKVLPNGHALATARKSEEAHGEEALDELMDLDPDSDEFNLLFSEFSQDVIDHAAAEETEVYMPMRTSCEPSRLIELAQAWKAAEMLAPTRPHPDAPKKPVTQLVTGPFVAVVDRIRDAVSARE